MADYYSENIVGLGWSQMILINLMNIIISGKEILPSKSIIPSYLTLIVLLSDSCSQGFSVNQSLFKFLCLYIRWQTPWQKSLEFWSFHVDPITQLPGRVPSNSYLELTCKKSCLFTLILIIYVDHLLLFRQRRVEDSTNLRSAREGPESAGPDQPDRWIEGSCVRSQHWFRKVCACCYPTR